MRIKELSSLVDLPIPTIRYYEKLGLIYPEKQGYYKEYTKQIQEQLFTIKKFHLAGLKLSQIQFLFSLNHKEASELSLKELQQIKTLLTSAIDRITFYQQQITQSKKMLEKMISKVNNLYEVSK